MPMQLALFLLRKWMCMQPVAAIFTLPLRGELLQDHWEVLGKNSGLACKLFDRGLRFSRYVD